MTKIRNNKQKKIDVEGVPYFDVGSSMFDVGGSFFDPVLVIEY